MKLNEKDQEKIVTSYTTRYDEFGYAPKSLYWDKGKQNLRFDILTSSFDMEGMRILDIGCGFGDLNRFLKTKTENYSYLGIDITEAFIREATNRYASEKIRFVHGDFLHEDVGDDFDIAIASGTFNFKFDHDDNYAFVDHAIRKALSVCKTGLAFDFLSDKVDYRHEHSFYYAPEKVLEIAYRYTRNVTLRNDYMPFEFTLTMRKDDSFQKEDTIFTTYKANVKDRIAFLV